MVSKYQERWYCMVITMLLAFAMLIAVPLITAQAYAMEGDQPTETIYQDDIIINTNSEEGSDGSEDELTNDNDSQIDPSLDISEVIDTEEEIVEENINEEDEPFTEKENQVVPSIDTSELIDNDEDLLNEILSEEVELEVKTLESSGSITWLVSTALELEQALEGSQDGETIKLMGNITYNKGIVIRDKNITFELGTYKLTVNNGSGPGLKVETNGEVHLTGSGEFNANGTPYGVLAEGSGAIAEVTSASGSSSGFNNGVGARAMKGGQITVNGPVWGENFGVYSSEGGNVIVKVEVNGGIGAESLGEASLVTITGNVKGTYTHGVRASIGGKITVHGKVTSSTQDGVYAVSGGEIEVYGDVEGANGAYASGNSKGEYGSIHITGNVTGLNGYGVYVKDGGKAVIDGNVTGWNGSGAHCTSGSIYVGRDVQGSVDGVVAGISNSTVEVKGNVIANYFGAYIWNYDNVKATGDLSGKIIIDGEIRSKGGYIKINNVVKDGTPASRDDISELDGYYSYSEINSVPIEQGGSDYATSVVFVKFDAGCEIGDVQYATLGEALKEVKTGETIKLLKNITHTDPIIVSGKTINFDLGDYDLLLDTSAKDSFDYALTVEGSGKVNLTGTGQFNVKGSYNGIKILGAGSHATVHNVEITGEGICVYMYGSGSALDGGTITVNGDIKAENGRGVDVNAKNGIVDVKGNITARRSGVNIASNPNTLVTVDRDITVIGNLYDEAIGIRAYGKTTVTVKGNLTVVGADCIGIEALGSTINVGGNVVSSSKGAHSTNGGWVGINGSLTAGTPFIVVGTTEMAADEGTKNHDGFIEYSDGNSRVIIGSIGVPVPEFTIIVQTDGNGTASANVNSAVEGMKITLTAEPNEGYIFKEWQVVSGDVSIENDEFTMPGENVTIKAIFDPVAEETYTVTVKGSYAETTGAGNYAEGDIVNIYAGNRSGYTFTEWVSSDVTITDADNKNARFTMPAKNVTVTANWNYNDSGSGGGGSSSRINATLSDIEVEYDKNENDDLKVTLKGGSYTLKSIKNSSYTLKEGKDYTISGGTVTFKASYLDSLKEGEYFLTFDMNGGKDPVLTVTVIDTTEEDTQEEILPVEETVYFEDVKATNWFYDAVNYVYNAGLMKGTSDTTFSPYVNTTRAMIVTILHRLEGTPKPITDNIFIDVEADKYYTDAVTWGKENKIVKGYGNDKFGPNDLITREQMAVILMNYADFKGYNVSIKADLNIFKDANQVSSWAQDGVAWANASELIIGKGEGILDPGSKTTRAEVATILERFVKNILK